MLSEKERISPQDESVNESEQKSKAYVRKEIAYWSERFNKSIKKARKDIDKTINDIGRARKKNR